MQELFGRAASRLAGTLAIQKKSTASYSTTHRNYPIFISARAMFALSCSGNSLLQNMTGIFMKPRIILGLLLAAGLTHVQAVLL